MSEGNFRNSVDSALNTAAAILGDIKVKDLRELSPAEQASVALAEAAVAIAHSLRRLAELAEDEADERKRPR